MEGADTDCEFCGGTGEVEVDSCDRRGEHITVTALCSCTDAQPDDEAEERRDDRDELIERNAPGAGWSL
jgi:hypothetical protein